jgi:hypothetical protein
LPRRFLHNSTIFLPNFQQKCKCFSGNRKIAETNEPNIFPALTKPSWGPGGILTFCKFLPNTHAREGHNIEAPASLEALVAQAFQPVPARRLDTRPIEFSRISWYGAW